MRIKVNLTHGNQMNATNTAVVGVRPSPRMIAGQLSPDDEGSFAVVGLTSGGDRRVVDTERAVFQWVGLNAAALVAYWDGQIDTVQLGQILRSLSP